MSEYIENSIISDSKKRVLLEMIDKFLDLQRKIQELKRVKSNIPVSDPLSAIFSCVNIATRVQEEELARFQKYRDDDLRYEELLRRLYEE